MRRQRARRTSCGRQQDRGRQCHVTGRRRYLAVDSGAVAQPRPVSRVQQRGGLHRGRPVRAAEQGPTVGGGAGDTSCAGAQAQPRLASCGRLSRGAAAASLARAAERGPRHRRRSGSLAPAAARGPGLGSGASSRERQRQWTRGGCDCFSSQPRAADPALASSVGVVRPSAGDHKRENGRREEDGERSGATTQLELYLFLSVSNLVADG